MSEQQNNKARNIGYLVGVIATTGLAVSLGVHASENKLAAVNDCAAELGAGVIHVDAIPEPCENLPVTADSPGADGYDLMPAARFIEENTPGPGYNIKWFGVYMLGGIAAGFAAKKFTESLQAPPDSATQRMNAAQNNASEQSQKREHDFTSMVNLPLPRRVSKNSNVRQPVNDNSESWMIADAATKLRAEQRRANGQA